MRSLLVTNDFPPKLGGIQSYLWELWRRLPPGDVGVLTTAYPGAAEWDAARPFPVERIREKVMLPSRRMRQTVQALARDHGADLVLLDPVFPIGAIGPRLGVPYVVVVHGAEVTVAAHVPGVRQSIRRTLGRAEGILAAGTFPAAEAVRAAGRPLRGLVVPPGVDTQRFRPMAGERVAAVRERFALDPDRPLVLGLSRLVPRKGFDVLIDAVAALPAATSVQLAIGGAGRDRARLETRARRAGLDVAFLGRVDDADLPDLYAAADVFAMLCRDRWRGLEQEGFGIVFLEAAACGVPSIAGRSGGSHEAVVDGETGYVVEPDDVGAVRDRLAALLADADLRARMGAAARLRAQTQFDNTRLAADLAPLAAGDLRALTPLPEFARP
ncbi:MAG TPA: glycosyltransferase family 4 protein [Acidimicrobiia bacterium]|nr:glycosyltransferase family 4 protein [Acidimicrobiia bacterium]